MFLFNNHILLVGNICFFWAAICYLWATYISFEQPYVACERHIFPLSNHTYITYEQHMIILRKRESSLMWATCYLICGLHMYCMLFTSNVCFLWASFPFLWEKVTFREQQLQFVSDSCFLWAKVAKCEQQLLFVSDSCFLWAKVAKCERQLLFVSNNCFL